MKYVLRILLLSVVLLLSMVLAASAAEKEPIDVDGISTNVYKVSDGFYQDGATYAASTNFYINSKEGLEYFRDLVSQNADKDNHTVVKQYCANYTSGNEANFYQTSIFKDKTVHLLADIDLNNEDWTPIGFVHSSYYDRTYFYGHFNGHNHKISNLKIVGSNNNLFTKSDGVNYGSYGLFGYIGSKKGQTFSNLTIENVEAVNGTTTLDYVGALIGNAGSNLITIENCHVKGNINLSASYEVGALFGIGKVEIKNCSVNGASGSTISSPNYYAGGLAGCQRLENPAITNCTVKDVTISAADAGGMVGLASVVMTISGGSVSNTEITGTSGAGSLIGSGATSSKTLSNVSTSENVKITENNKTVVKLSGSSVAKIGDTEYTLTEAAISAATEGQTVKIIKAGTYTLPAIPNNITIEGDTDGVVIFNCVGSGNICSISHGVTFRKLTFNFGTDNYHGFQHQGGTASFENCVLNGKLFSYGDMTFTECTFNNTSDYSMWVYGPSTVKYTSCDFYSAGKVLNVYRENSEANSLYVEGCKFHSTKSNKAALNVKATCYDKTKQELVPLTYTVYIDKNSTTDENFPAAAFPTSTLYVIDPVVQVDDINSSVENGILIYMENENGKITHNGKNYKQVYPYSSSADIKVSGLDDGESEILSLNAGETKILSAVLSPDNAIGGVSWSTEGMDTSLLTAISNDDGTITLTAGTTGGTTTIRVASQYYTDVSKDITVKVSIPTPAPSPTPTPTPEPEAESEMDDSSGGGGGGTSIVISSDSTGGSSGATDLTSVISSMSSGEKAAVTELIVTDNKNLTSLEGVEQLENLKNINLNNCTNLESVNLSANTSLTNITADNCTSLQIIEVKNNGNLETLSVKNAVSLQELDVSGCSSLSSLDCSGGSVEKISVQGCTSLADLSCQNNNLESLDVSGCENLTSLDCSANNLGNLNVEGCENLVNLKCGANSLSNLNVASCRRLEVLYCYSNNLTELNVQNSDRLYILVCDDNSLNTLNVDQNKLLRRLDCQNNAMAALDITSAVFQQLQRLKCYGQSLSGLTLSQSGGLYSFNLNSYMQSSELTAAAEETEINNLKSSGIDNVSGIKAYSASGSEIKVTGYEAGVISFASKPSKIVYNYDTGYNNTKMDVTISEQTNQSGGSTTGTTTTSGGGGGGSSGGCDAGFGIISALIILAGFFGIKKIKN